MKMNEELLSRRGMIITSAAALAGVSILFTDAQATAADEPNASGPREGPAAAAGKTRADQTPLSPGEAGKDYTPVITPNGAALPCKIADGVKVFHLIAEEVDHEFAPGLRAKC